MIGEEYSIGFIEVGKKVNFLILVENLVEDFSYLKYFDVVIKNGKMFNIK